MSEELRPLPIIDNRTPEQLKADGDDRWPNGTTYTPPSVAEQVAAIAETLCQLRALIEENRLISTEKESLCYLMQAASLDLRDILAEHSRMFAENQSAAAKLDEVAMVLQRAAVEEKAK